jgi:hypothetical protein
VSRGVKGVVEIGSAEGYAREAWLGMSRENPNMVLGRGVCVAREGRDRRRTFRERECGLVDWEVGWAMVVVQSCVGN